MDLRKKIVNILKENDAAGLIAINTKNANSISIYNMEPAAILSLGVAIIKDVIDKYEESNGKENADELRDDISRDILCNIKPGDVQ